MTRNFPNLSAPVAMLAMALLLTVGCTGSASAPADGSTSVEPAADKADKSKSDERIAPEFALVDLQGNTVKLSDTAGDIRLLDFWATWCAPCRDEIPMLNELHETYKDQGFHIMAISEESPEEIRDFAEEYDVAYTNLVGTTEIFEEYGALGLPTGVLIDGDGKIVERYFGPKPRKSLEEKIRTLLSL